MKRAARLTICLRIQKASALESQGKAIFQRLAFTTVWNLNCRHTLGCHTLCCADHGAHFVITSPLIEVSHLFCAPIWLECRATSSLPNSSNSSGRGRVVGSSHRQRTRGNQRTRGRILTMMRLRSSKGPGPMAFKPEGLQKRPGRALLNSLCLLQQIWRDRSTAPHSTSLALSQPLRLPCQWLILWERAC